MKHCKKLHFIALLIIPNQILSSQEQKIADTYYQENKRPLYFGLMSRISGISTIGGAVSHYTSINYWTLVELMLQIRPKLHIYTQFRVLIPISISTGQLSYTLPMISMNNIQLGTLLGLGGIIYSKKIYDRGWDIILNSGIVVDFGIHNSHYLHGITFSIAEISRQFLSLGIEINVRARYHLSEKFSLVVGTDIGYITSLNGGDSFLIQYRKITATYHTINYGLSLGVNF